MEAKSRVGDDECERIWGCQNDKQRWKSRTTGITINRQEQPVRSPPLCCSVVHLAQTRTRPATIGSGYARQSHQGARRVERRLSAFCSPYSLSERERMAGFGSREIGFLRPRMAQSCPAAGLHANDRFRREPTFKPRPVNGSSWSRPASSSVGAACRHDPPTERTLAA
jgi:hypothetical protein